MMQCNSTCCDRIGILDSCCAQLGYHMLGFHFRLNSMYYNYTALQKLIYVTNIN